MLLFSCIRGKFPAVKGFIYLCLFRNLHVVQMFHILFHIKGVFLVIIGQLFVPLVLRYIEFIREKWSDTSKLHDTFSTVHDRQRSGERPLEQKLAEEGFQTDVFIFPAGEKSKTRQTKAMLEDAMLEKGYRRDCCILAVGGGVVTDLAGFVAGTYGRGVPFINYATSLLAAADAPG